MDTLLVEPALKRADIVDHAASAEDVELRCEVAAYISALPCARRVALLLRLNHGLGYAEIAALLCCSQGEARASVYDTLCSLRLHVEDRL